jgi:hypothetical protein
MKSVSECEKAVKELTDKMNMVEASINDKEKEIAFQKEVNAKLVEATIGRKRMPKSLESQRQSIFKLNQEIEELEFARGSLEIKISEAKRQLHFAQVYTKVEAYKETEVVFFEKVNEIKEFLISLDKKILDFKEKVGDLKTFGHPLYQLQTILKELRVDNVSLCAFEQGKVEDHSQEDDQYLNAIVNKYRSLQRELPEVTNLNVVASDLVDLLFGISRFTSRL